MNKILFLFFIIFCSCSSIKTLENYSPDNDPNIQFYGKYDFSLSIDDLADFDMTLYITNSKGNIFGTMSVFWFQNQQTFNGIPVHNLKIEDNLITFNTYGSNRNNEQADFTIYFIDDFKNFQGILNQVRHPIPSFSNRSYFIKGTKTDF
jgi:hypothetical protein